MDPLICGFQSLHQSSRVPCFVVFQKSHSRVEGSKDVHSVLRKAAYILVSDCLYTKVIYKLKQDYKVHISHETVKSSDVLYWQSCRLSRINHRLPKIYCFKSCCQSCCEQSSVCQTNPYILLQNRYVEDAAGSVAICRRCFARSLVYRIQKSLY